MARTYIETSSSADEVFSLPPDEVNRAPEDASR